MFIVKKLKNLFPILALAMAAVLLPLSPLVVHASPQSQICAGANAGGACTGSAPLNGLIKSVINILLFVIGAAAVIVIVIGGLRYVLSGGDQAAVTAAKNTILYAVVGLVVSILAFSIVNFVVGSIK